MAQKKTFVLEVPSTRVAADPRFQALLDKTWADCERKRRNLVKHSVRRQSLDQIRSIMN
jgi:hypothetical protein